MKKLAFLILSISLLPVTCMGQNFFGLAGYGKWGSESIPFFVDSYGNEVTLSTGSGISAGCEYSYDFSWMFNLAVGASFNYSVISRKSKNAYGSFMAMGVHLTPSFTFPARPDPGLKVLIGAGPDFYSFGTIKIDATEAGGEDMTLKYKPAFGYHGQILFLLKFQDNSCIAIGPKYYSVSYSFREKGSTHFPTVREISNPDGSGFGLFVAFYQKF